MTETRSGRPPVLRDGIRASDLETFTLRLTPESKARLMALSEVTRTPAYSILEDLFADHWQTLDTDTRKRAKSIIAARR